MVQERFLVILVMLFICSQGITEESSDEQLRENADDIEQLPFVGSQEGAGEDETQVTQVVTLSTTIEEQEQQSFALPSASPSEQKSENFDEISKIEEGKDEPEQQKENPIPSEQETVEENTHADDDVEKLPQQDYTSALRDLSDAVRSLLPLREHMAVAAECSEGREAAMQAVIAEMRGRMVQLERQLSEAQEAERECQAEAQAIRAKGLESQLANCQGRLEEAHRPPVPTQSTLIRVEIVSRSHEDSDEENKAENVTKSFQQIGQVLEQAGTKIVNLVSSLENKIGDIHSISKDTLKFVESVQESEQEDNTQSDEVTKLTDQLNASQAIVATLRKQLEESYSNVETLKAQCNANITETARAVAAPHRARRTLGAVSAQIQECESRVTSSSAAARASCDAEAARMQGERLGYIVSLHTEHDATLTSVRNTCNLDKEKALSELNNTCQAEIEQLSSQLAAKEAECSEDCNTVDHHDVHDEKAQEQNVTLATMQANCDDALASLQERCDSEIRLVHLQYAINGTDVSEHEILRQVDIRIQQNTKLTSNSSTKEENHECKGFSEASSHIIDPEENEVSIRLRRQLYIVGIDKLQFDSAKEACKLKGMWLLELDTAEELADLIPRIQMLAGGESPEHSVWLSSRRNSSEGWFRWECGGERVQQELDNKQEGKDCLVVTFSRQLGGHVEWKDVACDEAHQIVCEIKLDHD